MIKDPAALPVCIVSSVHSPLYRALEGWSSPVYFVAPSYLGAKPVRVVGLSDPDAEPVRVVCSAYPGAQPVYEVDGASA